MTELGCYFIVATSKFSFVRFCSDPGVGKSVRGRWQCVPHYNTIAQLPHHRLLTQRFTFRKLLHPALFCDSVSVPLPNGSSMTFAVSVIDLKVRFLLALYVLSGYHTVLYFARIYQG